MPNRWDSGFDPEQVQNLDAAFAIAWAIVRANKYPELNSEEHYRVSLAQHIMAIAQSGVEPTVVGLANEAARRFQQQIALESREPDSMGG
jgi:hypothetical protein